MVLENPLPYILQAGQQKIKNQQQLLENLSGLGQNLGGAIGGLLQARRQKQQQKQWDQTINNLMNDPDIPQQTKSMLPIVAQKPGAWELLSGMKQQPQTVDMAFGAGGPTVVPPGGQSASSAPSAPASPTPPGAPPPMMPPGGQPPQAPSPQVVHGLKPGEAARILAAQGKKPAASFGSQMADSRNMQNLISDLPSKPNAMAAGGVQMAARLGKQMISKPGSVQEIALGSLDLARMATRAAPQMDAIRGAGFTDNIVSQLSMMQQKIKADPNGPDVPKIRKKMFDIFDEIDKSANPFIDNYMQDIKAIRGKNLPADWNGIVSRNLGKTLPDIPFQENNLGQGQTQQGGGGWGIQRVQ